MLVARGGNVDDAILVELLRRGRSGVLSLGALAGALRREWALWLRGLLSVGSTLVGLSRSGCSHVLVLLSFLADSKRQY